MEEQAASQLVLTTSKRIPRERIAMAERLYLAGKKRSYITSKLCKRFGVTARTARRYVALVEKRLAELPKPPPEATFQRVEEMLLEAFHKASKAVKVVRYVNGVGREKSEETKTIDAPETGVMVTAAWRLAELHGIVSEKLEVSTDEGDLSQLSDEDFAKLREIKAKLRAAKGG